ncbi:transcriptional regulator [Novosphingobium barchaimii]|nr:transcriptional regulator [Novosphingobium barchaimii]
MIPDFEDGKAPDALRTIGEVTRVLGIRQHVLRYWEEQFPMLSPVKRSGGRRYYRPEDIALIAEIDRLVHREGFTLRGARQFLETGQGAASAKTARVPEAVTELSTAKLETTVEPSQLMARLHEIRAELASALDRD